MELFGLKGIFSCFFQFVFKVIKRPVAVFLACNIKKFSMKALAHISHDIWLFCARPDTFLVKAMTHLLLLALIAFLLEGAITQLAEPSLEGGGAL